MLQAIFWPTWQHSHSSRFSRFKRLAMIVGPLYRSCGACECSRGLWMGQYPGAWFFQVCCGWISACSFIRAVMIGAWAAWAAWAKPFSHVALWCSSSQSKVVAWCGRTKAGKQRTARQEWPADCQNEKRAEEPIAQAVSSHEKARCASDSFPWAIKGEPLSKRAGLKGRAALAAARAFECFSFKRTPARRFSFSSWRPLRSGGCVRR